MTITEIISKIEQKHREYGITLNPPASALQIENFETKLGFTLPKDFKEFYSICNGFECTEDIFRVISIDETLGRKGDYGENWFYFAEYMIYSDMWSLRKRDDGEFEIFNKGEVEVVLTSSLQEFLERFLKGNVFGEGGLYDWHEEKKY